MSGENTANHFNLSFSVSFPDNSSSVSSASNSNNSEESPIHSNDSAIPGASLSLTGGSPNQTLPDSAPPSDEGTNGANHVIPNASGLWIQDPPPTIVQSENLFQALKQDAPDWFLIRVNAIAIFRNHLCTTNCAPGSASATRVTAAINQAIGMIRRAQPNQGWTPQDVSILVGGQKFQTNISNPRFRTAFKAEVSFSRHELMQRAYDCTRQLLAPSNQQLEGFAHPRIVLLRTIGDIATASNWTGANGHLAWDDVHGFHLFHVVTTNHGVPTIIWFGRPAIKEFLHHFFRESNSVGFVEVYQNVRNQQGFDEWTEITHATDAMLAFGLGWIVSVIESDVLENNAFTENIVTKRRREHFLRIYGKILCWLQNLRGGASLLSPESSIQATHGVDILSELLLPDLSFDLNPEAAVAIA